MNRILALLVTGLLISGCTVVAMQPAAMAYEGTPTPTAYTPPLIPAITQAALPAAAIPPTQPPPNPPTPQPSPTTAPYRYMVGPYYFPEDTNPLTGLPAEDLDLLERRPIVIKVTNFPRSVRPQWGLSLADNVFEYYIGDSMSRFIGVFYGRDAGQVGPIRSARLFDEHVMRMYNGIFVFGWADDPVLEFFFAPDIKPHLLVERPDNCPPLCRIGSDDAYNNLFADTSQIGEYLAYRRTNNDRQDLYGLKFDLDPPKSGNPGEKFFLKYSVVSYHYWEYDPVRGRYLRYQEIDDATDGKEESYGPLMDSLTAKQISANNVVVLMVPHDYFLRSSSTEILDQKILGEGKGFAFRDGYIYPINWSQEARDQRIKMILPNGARYSLKPGNTWFEIIGESSSFEPGADGTYRFVFDIP